MAAPCHLYHSASLTENDQWSGDGDKVQSPGVQVYLTLLPLLIKTGNISPITNNYPQVVGLGVFLLLQHRTLAWTVAMLSPCLLPQWCSGRSWCFRITYVIYYNSNLWMDILQMGKFNISLGKISFSSILSLEQVLWSLVTSVYCKKKNSRNDWSTVDSSVINLSVFTSS